LVFVTVGDEGPSARLLKLGQTRTSYKSWISFDG
jgi:hypothetical protein